MSKVCRVCKEDTPLSEFYKAAYHKDGLQTECGKCARIKAKRYYHSHREERRKYARDKQRKAKAEGNQIKHWVLEKYGGVPCLDCEGIFPFCAMDFHHRPDETKRFCIASQGTAVAVSGRIAAVEKEIAKCDLVCSCCHRIRHEQG